MNGLHMSTQVALKCLSLPLLSHILLIRLLLFVFLFLGSLLLYIVFGRFEGSFETALFVDGEVGGREFPLAVGTLL